MTAPTLSHVTTGLIQTYGNTALNVVSACRAGSERLGEMVGQRYSSALRESSPQLTAQARHNAAATRKVIGGYYEKGIAMTTEGAQAVITSVVRYSGLGIQQMAANAGKFQEKTGVTALDTLAQAAVPAVVAVSELAGKVEEKTAALAGKLGATRAARTSAFRKARARRA